MLLGPTVSRTMNEKQVKLLRYFVKHTGDLVLAGAVKVRWPTLNHKKKGQLTAWMKRVIVTMLHVSKEQKKARQAANQKALDSFLGVPKLIDQYGRAQG